jgi:signal transduction histidine kinase
MAPLRVVDPGAGDWYCPGRCVTVIAMEPTPAEPRELATLLGVASSVASTLELGPLLRLVLDHLKAVADYSGSSICVVEGDDLCILESRGASAAEREEAIVGVRLPLARGGRFWRELARGEPVIIADVRADGELARAYRSFVGQHFEGEAIRYIRSLLAVPLVHRERVIGLLTLSRTEPGYYTPRHARLATAIATHAAAAIENARLYEQARAAQAGLARQLDRLAALAGITQQLLAATELDAVLAVVVESAVRLSETNGAAVGLVEDQGRRLRFVAVGGEPRDYAERFGTATLDEAFLGATAIGQALRRREVIAIGDYTLWRQGAQPHQAHAVADALQLRAVVVAPLLVDGATIGVLRVHDTAARTFAPEDVGLIQALADQAALAIEHARLLDRGREAAILEERSRLARELHDSVTQSIFSLSMLSQAARQQHERASDQLGPTLERIGVLAQEALIEMRSLLFELHPASLAEKGLARALEQLIASMRLRGGPTIAYSAETDARPEPEAELALLRIAQEALANAIKHAGAGEVSVTLVEAAGRLTVTVTDDGAGFDPSTPVLSAGAGRSGGMGLRSMRERAAQAGVALEILSAPDAGTTVRATAPLAGSSPAEPVPNPA